jgi:outer membrane protein assembly factor BamB
MRKSLLAGTAFCLLAAGHALWTTANAADWYNWRGPWQTGVSPETDLPEQWSTDAKDPDSNLIWKAPYGCRSTPLVMNGRVFIINNVGTGITSQERVMSLDADTGKVLWEHKFNVFYSAIVSVRLGWANLAGDPQTGNVYAHGTQGLLLCFNRDGKVLWSRSLTEEYGRITGYGGRVTGPVVDGELVIMPMMNSSWGDQAKGANRFLAMHKLTGAPVWWAETGGVQRGTYYSTPVVAMINGQRLLISGTSDGTVVAFKVQTGERVWSYQFSRAAINSSAVVDGTRVYIGHGEESPDNNIKGRVICVDAAEVKNGAPRLVWQKDGIKARYASPIVHEGRLYVPDEIGQLYCLDAKDGTQYWKYAYGTDAQGSPVLADGKIYVAEVNSKFHILKPGPRKCQSLHEHFFPAADGVSDVELYGTPAVANGRVYFATSEEIYCIGKKGAKPAPPVKLPEPEPKKGAKPVHVQLIPADVTLHPGDSVIYHVRAFDEFGNLIGPVDSAKLEWSLPAPPLPPGAKVSPPPLKGEQKQNWFTPAKDVPAQQGYVVAKLGDVVAKARVRVAPQLPYQQNFAKIPDGAVPGGWVNTQGKFLVATLNGEKVLKKVNDKSSPVIARGNAYISVPTMSAYTIQADVMGTKKLSGAKKVEDMPDMGIAANRYTLFLAGNVQKLRLVSWDALPRIDETIAYPWQPGLWYRLKLTVDVQGDKAIVRGKVWPRDQKEPAGWTVQITDPRPNTEGSPALYGYVTGILEGQPGNDIFYDNVSVTPNKK